MTELKALLAEIHDFLHRALANDGYIVSDAGKDDTLQLIDHAKVVNNSLRVENSAFCTFFMASTRLYRMTRLFRVYGRPSPLFSPTSWRIQSLFDHPHNGRCICPKHYGMTLRLSFGPPSRPSNRPSYE